MKFGAFLVLWFFLAPAICDAYDTDLYVLSGTNIPPNVFIILDSSASMDEVSSGQNYDPATDYSLYGPPTIYPGNEVYYKSGGGWVDSAYTTSTLACPDLVNNYLLPYGQATNYSNTICGYNKKDFQTGNFMNFMQLSGGPGGNRPRFGLATGIIHSYVNTTMGVRFAVMAFNRDNNGNTVRNSGGTEYVSGDSRDDPLTTPWDAVGGRLLSLPPAGLGFVDEYKNGKTEVFNDLATLKNDSWSPLAETLYEAGTVFQTGTSALTGTNYLDVKLVQYPCQKNYVLIISDGVPTKDSDPRLSSVSGMTDLNGNGKIELDEVSKYLYNLDLSNGTALQKQNIKTYTVGFSMTQPLLEDTARNGGGKYFYVWSSQSFNIAFQTFIAEVLQESVSYVAPVVPISQMERTSAGNQLYLAMFKPTMTSFWKGNIKKYCLATKSSSGQVVDCRNIPVTDSTIKVGDILDRNGALLLTSSNDPNCQSCTVIKNTAQSYWGSVDGGDTEKGGVGEVLQNRDPSTRNIYTYFKTNTDLTNSSNTFSTSNSNITPSTLGLASTDTTGKNNVINFIRGYDTYYQNELPSPQGPTAKRNWILGAFIHSRPAVVHYATRSVIYAGANDGMLHAFDDGTGEELWGFIPPDLLPNLKNLTGEALQFYVDGPPKAYVERDSSNTIVSATLIFGERRGGSHYTALDITDPLVPKFLWSISPSAITYQTTETSSTAYQEMGQTWSTPQLGQINGGQWVAFLSGGYDVNQDLANPGTDTKGRAIYVVNLSNGSLLRSYSHANNADMRYCIPGDITRVDTNNDGDIDRLYAGDVGGQMWRFDLGSSGLTGKILFDSSAGLSAKRKIFYPPDVALEQGYEMIFFGTGDREHPKDMTKTDRLYAIKDKNPSSALTENDLVDVTQDLLQVGTNAQQTSTLNALQTQSGWFIKLDQNPGEKCLSSSILFYGNIYFTTFTPILGDPLDPCFLSQGEARLYALNYKTGVAVFNLDGIGTATELTRDDRSTRIGVSIPSGVVITFVGGTTVAYGGVGGGVYRPPLPTTKSVFPVSWRIVF